MTLSRRDFLKLSAGAAASVVILDMGDASKWPSPRAIPLTKRVGEKTTICPYDGSGCGFLVASENGKLLHIEGDPDHPVNRGAACAKGASMFQLGAQNPRRLSKVLYRRPGGTDWEEKDWDWALDQMARRIKKTRDENWIELDPAGSGTPVRRTEAISSFGACALDNEEAYLLSKMLRSIGAVGIEHHARL
jgi:formate dehydrogenase major subunit